MELEICRYSDNATFTSTTRLVRWNNHKGHSMLSLHANRTASESTAHSITRQITPAIDSTFVSCYESGGDWLPLVAMLRASAVTAEEIAAVDSAERDLMFREAMADLEAMTDTRNTEAE